MRKIIVSSVVVIAFIFYSVHQRTEDEGAMPIVAPKDTTVQVSPTPPQTLFIPDTPQAAPSNIPQPTSGYKDGTYKGDPADAFYGNIRVQATIANGRITDIQFLQYPNDRRTSIEINQQADPMLAQEAIRVQSAHVDIISGATDSSQAFIQSLQSALNQAKS